MKQSLTERPAVPDRSDPSDGSDRRDQKGGRAAGLLLILTLLVAFALRWPGMRWGCDLVGGHTPYVQLHPDEPTFARMARALHEGSAVRTSYVLGMPTLLRVPLAIGAGFGRELSEVQLIMTARWLSLLSGLALIAVVYLLARRLSSREGFAPLAASLAAVHTLLVTHSTYGTADMLYTLLASLFALVVVGASQRPVARGLLAAGVAGAAMAVKFGLIFLPSVLLLAHCAPRRRWLWGGLFLFASLVVFLVAQGFAFGAASMQDVWRLFHADNVGGFDRDRRLIPLVYGLMLLRSSGWPVMLLGLAGAMAFLRRPSAIRAAVWIAFLPVLLHGAAILGINASFPRHLLPLLPLWLLIAAWAVCRLRKGRLPVALGALLWSGALTVTDGIATWRDSRGEAMQWLASHVEQDSTVWADPYVKIPMNRFYPAAPPAEADYVVLHEGWTYRFERSELSPRGNPTALDQIYHAAARPWDDYRHLMMEADAGQLAECFVAGPVVLLPEQRLYAGLWGSLNKFAGTCRVLQRVEAEAISAGRPLNKP